MTITLTTRAPKRTQVWDLGVRLIHWATVSSVALAYLMAEDRGLHRLLGYAVLALVGFRLIWGLVGGHHARFVNFVPGPRRFVGYVVDIAKAREARHLGHNPAGAVMIVALLLTLLGVGGTGYMMGLDAYFGIEWVEDSHKALVNLLLVLVGLHVGGVVLSSRRHRENLVLAMVTGQKEVAEDGHV